MMMQEANQQQMEE